jgi:hypothetical protein
VTGGWLDLPPRVAGHLRCPAYPPDYAARHSRAAGYAEFRYGLHATVPEPADSARRPPPGSSGHQVYVFEQSAPIDPSKTMAAVTLPSLGDMAGCNLALHMFAMSIG